MRNILFKTKYFTVIIIALLLFTSMFTFLLPLKQVQADPRSNAQAFVTKFYNIFLDRDPDDFGLEIWTNNLISGEQSGADMAFDFVFSAEFTIKNVSDEEYVMDMFEAFFNREPDNSEYDHWLEALGNGSTRYSVLVDFINSEEFRNLCETYNISPGELPIDGPFFVTGEPKLTVHFMEVRQGDSILIQAPDGKVVLIDGGWRDNLDKVSSYIERLGIKQIDILVVTHPHPDHLYGLINVLNDFKVDKVIDLGVPYASKIYWEYLKAIGKSDANYINWSVGSELNLGPNTRIKIIAPFNYPTDLMNNSSIVLKLTYKDVSFLFVGDAEVPLETEILSSGQDISAQVLKVGHHGASSSSSMAFLEKINPSVAVIFLGLNNEYGFPHSIVMERLDSLGVRVYRTDVYRDVVIYSDGNIIHVLN